MKSLPLVIAVAVVLVSQAVVSSIFADGSATGAIHATVNGGTMNIEFNARARDDSGAGTGQITFRAPVDLPDVDEDSEFGEKGSIPSLFLKIDLDCVRIAGNQAAMSGLVREANVVGYGGRRIVLAVEDGGEGSRAEPDKFTWGVYAVQHVKWIPTDAELEFDDGWGRSWIATDAEREDDPGVRFNRVAETDCRSFPLSSYTYIELPQGTGNIQVRP